MRERLMVKEPPRDGEPSQARYHLQCLNSGLYWELVGWTNERAEADDWLKGFGPIETARVEDRRSWVTEPAAIRR